MKRISSKLWKTDEKILEFMEFLPDETVDFILEKNNIKSERLTKRISSLISNVPSQEENKIEPDSYEFKKTNLRDIVTNNLIISCINLDKSVIDIDDMLSYNHRALETLVAQDLRHDNSFLGARLHLKLENLNTKYTNIYRFFSPSDRIDEYFYDVYTNSYPYVRHKKTSSAWYFITLGLTANDKAINKNNMELLLDAWKDFLMAVIGVVATFSNERTNLFGYRLQVIAASVSMKIAIDRIFKNCKEIFGNEHPDIIKCLKTITKIHYLEEKASLFWEA